MALPVGKLPPDLLEKIIKAAPTSGHRVKLGPGIGLDCAVLDFGDDCLVLKTEPITFATQDIGWYAVQIAANDIATTGARPKWLMLTALLPEGITSPELVDSISAQVAETCRSLDIILIGGHTEITYGLDRPILVSTLIAEIKCQDLITPKGAMPGDRLVLTKGVPIEATALLAREFPEKLQAVLTQAEIEEAQNFIYEPGISVLPEAQIACNSGRITAMHDPTEGGIVTALWELAEACDHTLVVTLNKIPVPEISKIICATFQLNPFGTLSSGALLMCVNPSDTTTVISKLQENGIPASEIGYVEAGPPRVQQITSTGKQVLIKYARDEITRVFESDP